MAAGDVFRHDYDRVAEDRVWRTVAESLPPMIAVVQQRWRRLTDVRPIASREEVLAVLKAHEAGERLSTIT